MNLPTDFPELDELKEKMNARTEPEIDMRLRVIGVDVTEDNFKIEDEIPMVHNRKVVLYLPDVWSYRRRFEDKDPTYHVVHCNVVQRMKTRGTYINLSSTRRSDGKFSVKLSDGIELSLIKLTICKPCLGHINYQYPGVFPTNPAIFPLEDWFEPFFYLSEDWKERSQACRESANWTCQNQNCKINLETDPHLLHAHHKWGTRYNDPDDLIALCIRCHSQQPGGGHSLLTTYPEYQEFMKKYGDLLQTHNQTELQYSRSTAIQEDNAFSFSQDNTIDDNIPF